MQRNATLCRPGGAVHRCDRGCGAHAKGTIDLGTVKPEALFAQASTVLSEPQLAAFKQPELRRRQLAANPTL